MLKSLSTGNATVDIVGQMNLTGNVIPPIWYRTVLNESGKAHLMAINILSEICYWYRPTVIRDEQTGQVLEYRKKFKEDLLQKNYQQLADQFGQSKRTIKAAMDTLENLGVITRVWRNKTVAGGLVLNNVLYIALNEDKLHEITFCDVTEVQKDLENQVNSTVTENCNTHLQKSAGGVTENCSTLLQKNVGGGTENCNTLLRENVGDVTEKCNTLLQEVVIAPTNKCETYTENTSEIATETTFEITEEKNLINPIYHVRATNVVSGDEMDEIDAIYDYVKSNIEYEALICDHPHKKKVIDELVDIMVEVMLVEKPTYWINQCVVSRKLVVSHFQKFNQQMMEYVLRCLGDNTTKVKNVKNYLLTTLYNAPMTIENYYHSEVMHDMYGDK